MHLRCMTEYVRRNQMPASLSLGFLLLLFPAHTRKSCPSITCRAGYYAVHLLRKYTTMLGFFPHYKSREKVTMTLSLHILPIRYYSAVISVYPSGTVMPSLSARSLIYSFVKFGADCTSIVEISAPFTRMSYAISPVL